MKQSKLWRAVSVLVVAGWLVGLGAGAASAATPIAGSDAAAVTSVGTSEGIHLYNNSSDNLVLTNVSGDNEGVPTVGSTLTSGKGYQDFEVTFRAAKTTTVTADYDVYDATNTKIGTAVVKLSLDSVKISSVTGTFTAMDSSKLPLEAESTGGISLADFQIVGNSSTPVTLDASNPLAAALVKQYCAAKNTGATCSYTPASRTPGTDMTLLAYSYTLPGGGNTPGTVSVSSGYDSSTTDSWAISVSAGVELADVFSTGIQGTYGQSVTWQNMFSADESIQVDPGYTGYIWGKVPVTTYSGTMQITIGNTTYQIQNAALTSPDPSRTLSDFWAGTWAGDNPLNSPAQPPAGATPLT